MHNLLANIAKFSQLLIEVFGSDNLINGNFRRYSNQPKALDIELIALAFAAGSMQIDSENMLYSILKSSYPQYCSTLPDRTNFNRRRRFLQPFIGLYQNVEVMNYPKEKILLSSIQCPFQFVDSFDVENFE